MRNTTTPDLSGRTMIVTGANAGIGKETAVGLARMGATVVMTARNPAKGAEALEEVRRRTGSRTVELGLLDLASLASVREFAQRFLSEHDRLDVLVNNAGLITDSRTETADGFEQMFGVNHLGHFLLTELLRDRLVASAPSRVVVVSSIAHRAAIGGLRFDDLQSERSFRSSLVYGRSKLANLLFTLELAEQLAPEGVTVNAVHPGSINSHFGGGGDTKVLGRLISKVGRYVLRSPEVGARASILLASSNLPKVTDSTGAYFPKGHRRPASRRARDVDAARRLWAMSERLVGSASSTCQDDGQVL
ncbi:MAG: SDR family oxidoreductase [Acidimicrobiales bacterium]|nr:SDR family oxidoreductase [Acidimicrobiales bacterium]